MNIGQLDQAVLCHENSRYGQVIDITDDLVTVRTGIGADEGELNRRLRGLGTLKSLIRRRVIEPRSETIFKSPFQRIIEDPSWSLVQVEPVREMFQQEVERESLIMGRFHPLEPGTFSSLTEYMISYCKNRLPLDLSRPPRELAVDVTAIHDIQLLLHIIGRGELDSASVRRGRIERLISRDGTTVEDWEGGMARIPTTDLFILSTSCLSALARLREYEKGIDHGIDSILSSIEDVERILSTRLTHIRHKLKEYLTR